MVLDLRGDRPVLTAAKDEEADVYSSVETAIANRADVSVTV